VRMRRMSPARRLVEGEKKGESRSLLRLPGKKGVELEGGEPAVDSFLLKRNGGKKDLPRKRGRWRDFSFLEEGGESFKSVGLKKKGEKGKRKSGLREKKGGRLLGRCPERRGRRGNIVPPEGKKKTARREQKGEKDLPLKGGLSRGGWRFIKGKRVIFALAQGE